MAKRTQKTNEQVCNQERLTRTLKVRNRMNKALGLLVKAQDEMRALLDEVNADVKETNNWYLTGDLSHFFAEVSNVISTDKGECGLLPFVYSLTKEIEASKSVSRKPTQEQIAKALLRAYR
jgi:hypothetical protein